MRQCIAVLLSMSIRALAGETSTPSGSEWSTILPPKTDIAPVSGQQPTESPPQSTPPPIPRGRMRLWPRLEGYTLGANTCGFRQDNELAVTCLRGVNCITSDSYIGCCYDNAGCPTLHTACVDYKDSLAGSCKGGSKTICCSSNLPACYTFSMVASRTLMNFDCRSTSGTGILFDYDPTWSRLHYPSTGSSSPTSGLSAGPGAAQTGTTGEAGNREGGGQNNVGVIVGGVVGGLAAVGLIAVAAALLLRRRDSSCPNGKCSIPAEPTVQGQPQGPYPSSQPPQGHDWHTNAFDPQLSQRSEYHRAELH